MIPNRVFTSVSSKFIPYSSSGYRARVWVYLQSLTEVVFSVGSGRRPEVSKLGETMDLGIATTQSVIASITI